MNVQKAILPGLWAVMDSGGHGCAKVIHPCFLPLLSHLVDKVSHVTFDCRILLLIFSLSLPHSLRYTNEIVTLLSLFSFISDKVSMVTVFGRHGSSVKL